MYLGVKFLFVLTLSPYILLRKTQGESVRCISLSPLLRCYSKCPAMLAGYSRGRGLKSTNILNFSIAVPRSVTANCVSNRGIYTNNPR